MTTSGSFKVMSTLGLVGSSYKTIVKSNKTSNRFVVWYDTRLDLEVNDEVIISGNSDFSEWYSISNPRTNRNSKINDWSKVN